jgi:Na+/H+ antiporter NhaD/arsenite permease-like protein
METLGHILPLWSVSFFVLMLLAIAVLPLTHGHFWESNFNKGIVAVVLSIPVIILFAKYGDLKPVMYEIKEYFSFIVLLGSLFVVSGGIFLSGDLEATPKNNTIFLLIGGIIANIFGTTGAAMLLIKPFLRTNKERKFVSHIPIFFIFIVCNIGGCLLPIGDPPLFMGYLRGVPFFWTLKLFPEWLFMMALILVTFYIIDLYYYKKEDMETIKLDRSNVEPIRIHGKINIIFILVILLSVIFIETPFREGTMILSAIFSLIFTGKDIHKKNEFNYAPIIEVAVLFAGIFITMVPALLILEARGGEVGVRLPWHFFWVTGGLSSFLDNTPTYLTYLSLAQGLANSLNLPKEVIGIPFDILKAISLGAVFMGANTYIGNGPNFMVKVICENQKIKIPSFFGYMVWSGLILIPLFVIVTFVFFI